MKKRELLKTTIQSLDESPEDWDKYPNVTLAIKNEKLGIALYLMDYSIRYGLEETKKYSGRVHYNRRNTKKLRKAHSKWWDASYQRFYEKRGKNFYRKLNNSPLKIVPNGTLR